MYVCVFIYVCTFHLWRTTLSTFINISILIENLQGYTELLAVVSSGVGNGDSGVFV